MVCDRTSSRIACKHAHHTQPSCSATNNCLITLLLCALCTARAQSIAGNLHEGTGRAALGYGNVDIFRGDELIASVLTDRYGNFNVRLDTGEYKCVVNYDGYESETRIVRVKADEKVDFAVKEEQEQAQTRAPHGGQGDRRNDHPCGLRASVCGTGLRRKH